MQADGDSKVSLRDPVARSSAAGGEISRCTPLFCRPAATEPCRPSPGFFQSLSSFLPPDPIDSLHGLDVFVVVTAIQEADDAIRIKIHGSRFLPEGLTVLTIRQDKLSLSQLPHQIEDQLPFLESIQPLIKGLYETWGCPGGCDGKGLRRLLKTAHVSHSGGWSPPC